MAQGHLRRFFISTLGCRVNQYESAAMGYQLELDGFSPAASWQDADLCIVNTCAVTHSTEAQSRQIIRKILRETTHCTLIVTGCYAQTSPEEIRALSDRIFVLGNCQKDELSKWLATAFQKKTFSHVAISDISKQYVFSSPPCLLFRKRTRALLKIQDGCNSKCSYCIVPLARGPSRSLAPDEALIRMENLIGGGYREIVLTGIHLGAYGLDLSPQTTLASLLKRMVSSFRSSGVRIRLSSLEPNECTDEIISVVASGADIICPHIHISLQSGDDDILRAMHRPYTTEGFENLLEQILHSLPGVNIGLDVIAGFPKETDKQFEHTLALIKRHDIGYLHVFPFSSRRGTPAADFPGQISESVKKHRVHLLRSLGMQKKQSFICTQLGKEHRVLIERKRQNTEESFFGTTRNYISVRISADTAIRIGQEVKVKLAKICDGFAEGIIVSN